MDGFGMRGPAGSGRGEAVMGGATGIRPVGLPGMPRAVLAEQRHDRVEG